MFVYALLAQLVEQLTLNQTVGGSNPSQGTNVIQFNKCALVVQWIEREPSKL